MEQSNLHKVTVIFYNDVSLELLHETHDFHQNAEGRVILPQAFKEGKSIIAVCEGEIEILNKLGDRITLIEDVDYDD
ncbi:MAG: TIGR02922 family protein [Gammaproteobacteria bacterium]|nr:MAG: TIGR02922 family protein [Gammaproteobacteria bacterium]